MSNKRMSLIFIAMITLVGFVYGLLKTGSFSKELYNKNIFTPIENYALLNGISEEQLRQLDVEKYLILYSEKDLESIKIKDNVQKTLDYIKKPYEIVEAGKFDGLKYKVTAIIMSFENLEECPRIEEVFSFVKQGGSVLFAQRIISEDLEESYQNILGIEESKGFIEKRGIELLNNLLINNNDFRDTSIFISNSCLDVTLKTSAEVYAKTGDGLPLIWSASHGKGKIVFCNGTMLNDSGNRGILLGAVGLLQTDFIYPIINAKVNFIDDFPAPTPSGTIENIYDNVEMNIEQFYRMIWWPDMLRTAKACNLKYSGLVIETYNNEVEAPFIDDNKQDDDSLFFFGEELLNNDGELGIHGYNHQSLTYDKAAAADNDYNVWKSEKDVKASLEQVREFVRNVYPKYNFRAYVPPSNILGKEVREQFPNLFPDIKIISSLYVNNNYGNSYVQEFEIAKDGIIEFPRFSWGYMSDNTDMWNIYNGVSLHGVISHFVHPDDVLNAARSEGKSWGEMYQAYDNLCQTLHKKYQWMRPMTISEAGEELKKYMACNVYTIQTKDELYGYCQNFRKDMYFILRTPKNIVTSTGCSFKKIDENVYLVYSQQPKFSIKLEEVRGQ